MELKLYCNKSRKSFYGLLIVPYGIETGYKQQKAFHPLLLIVPYGIETQFYFLDLFLFCPFNRTLWN